MAAPPSLVNLKPAIAGFVIDNSVGRKELYATFIDLVLRGRISLVKTRKGNSFVRHYAIAEDKAQNSKKPEDGVREDLERLDEIYGQRPGKMSILPHEHFVLSIFKKGVLMDENSVKERLEEVLDENFFRNAVEESSSRLGLYDEKFTFEVWSPNGSENSLAEWLMAASVALLPVVLIWRMTNAYGDLFSMIVPVEYMLAVLISKVFLFPNKVRRTDMVEQNIQKNGRAQRERYRQLYAWLKAHPLSDYRWSNEFLPYAVAFGLYRDYDKFPK